MILWLLLISLSIFSQDQAVEEFCFSSPAKMKEVHQRLKFILVPVDKVQENKNCFTVNTSTHRRELIQSYVRRLESSVQISFSSVEMRQEPCRIKVERIKNLTKQGSGGSVAMNGENININASEGNTTHSGTDVTSIQTLKEFELTVNQDVAKGECRFISPTRYEIALEVRKDAVPLTPPLRPGTVVVIPDAQIPKDQETSRLQTTLQLNRGERVEIGGIVKDLKNDTKKADASTGAELKITNGVQSEKVFLSID